MLDLLWLVPMAPLAGFLILALAGARLPRRAVAALGLGSAGVSLAAALTVAAGFFALPETGRVYEQNLGAWIQAGDLAARFALHLDGLALVMMLVVALVAERSMLPHTFRGLAALLAMAWISHSGGQGLLSIALGRLPAAFSSLVIFLEAIAAAGFGWLILGEPVSAVQALGGLAILAGIVVARPR